MRAALAEEVAELLTDWPADCPTEMRGACEALLARAALEVDEQARTRLRIRLYADPALSSRVLPRGDKALVHVARAGEPLAPRLARALGVPESLANEILQDHTGHALAVAAKAIGMNRAAFSTLALLSQPGGDLKACYARLDAFESISPAEASRELRRWSDQRAA